MHGPHVAHILVHCGPYIHFNQIELSVSALWCWPRVRPLLCGRRSLALGANYSCRTVRVDVGLQYTYSMCIPPWPIRELRVHVPHDACATCVLYAMCRRCCNLVVLLGCSQDSDGLALPRSLLLVGVELQWWPQHGFHKDHRPHLWRAVSARAAAADGPMEDLEVLSYLP